MKISSVIANQKPYNAANFCILFQPFFFFLNYSFYQPNLHFWWIHSDRSTEIIAVMEAMATGTTHFISMGKELYRTRAPRFILVPTNDRSPRWQLWFERLWPIDRTSKRTFLFTRMDSKSSTLGDIALEPIRPTLLIWLESVLYYQKMGYP